MSRLEGPREFAAQLSVWEGRWRLYVVLLGSAERWPEFSFGRRRVVPSVQERSRALDRLGYVLADGARWEWSEDSEIPDDPGSPVLLIGSVRVCSRTEAAL
ncbi:DUF6303 family protein [Streptomyces sp. C10-9-1]|uniref:DUF6303 family protein n=1 Tax=Streptomyces sp. C10-9-1 TaxID=1859285 RepID=UPI003F4A4539